MGEAKRKRLLVGSSPCLCGSGKPAKQCCFNGSHWHKAPANLGLKDLPLNSAASKCYMHTLGSCGGGISGEHLISESIIHLLKGAGDFSVSGLPWLEEGETKLLAPGNLTANCLCRVHNSALHKLDDAALSFFEAIKAGLAQEAGSESYLVSGHDIERWLLKTAKAMAASRNLSRGRQRLSGAFATDVQVLDMLDNPKLWPESAGLYCVMDAGDTMVNHLRFRLYPLTNEDDAICGVGADILGINFVLMLDRFNINTIPILKNAKFRPSNIIIDYPLSRNQIGLSWEDGKIHKEVLSLQFLRPFN